MFSRWLALLFSVAATVLFILADQSLLAAMMGACVGIDTCRLIHFYVMREDEYRWSMERREP